MERIKGRIPFGDDSIKEENLPREPWLQEGITVFKKRKENMEPTKEQKREFWKWYGLRQNHWTMRWFVDENTEADPQPRMDLNSLFKYAVPIAIDKIMAEQECSSDLAYWILFKKWLQELELDIPNHERTLFSVLYEVMKNGTD